MRWRHLNMVFEYIQTAQTLGSFGLSHGLNGDSSSKHSVQTAITCQGRYISKSHFVVAIHGVDYDGDMACSRGV